VKDKLDISSIDSSEEVLFSKQKSMFSKDANCMRPLNNLHHATGMAASRKVLSVDNMNPHLKKMEYAVRGPINIRAGEIEEELKKVDKKLSFFFCAPKGWHIVIDLSVRQPVRPSVRPFFVRSIILKLCKAST